MARVRKENEYISKKKKIIIESIKLLNEIGYDMFSLNKAIESAGMTKGAFFHYFNSKKELIDEIINYFQSPLIEALEEISNNNSVEPKDKILLMANSVSMIKTENKETVFQLMNLLNKKENIAIAEMINDKSIETFLPIYEKVLIEGNNKGQFNVTHPNGSAFIYFSALAAVRKEIDVVMNSPVVNQERYLKLMEKVKAFEDYARDLFNLDESIEIIDKKSISINRY